MLTISGILATAFACFMVLFQTRKKDPSGKKMPWMVVPLMALLGGSCLAGSELGGWLASTIGSILGTTIIGLIVIGLIIAIYFDLRDKRCDKTALVGLILLPVLFQAGTGPISDIGGRLTGGVAGVAENSIGRIVGG